jgi:hypothetical protein
MLSTQALSRQTTGHDMPHAPQFVRSFERFTSQPLLALPSQSAKPSAHRYSQVLLAQVAVALARAAHGRPHPPQCCGVLVTVTSHPLLALPSQSPKPAAQTTPHAPAEHVAALALLGTGQGALVVESPSALHTRRTPAVDAQDTALGVHTHAAHMPAAHELDEGQVVFEALKPSGAQRSSVCGLRHRARLGVQTCMRQVPKPQTSPTRHPMSMVPKPSGLQTLRVLGEAQLALPGMQSQGRHDPPVQL